jgi:phosphohistidine phosphatase
MKLYILRHAIAEPGGPGIADSKRKLTEEGRVELQQALAGARKLKVRPDLILSSPYRRAWETAVLAAQALLGEGEVVEFRELTPEGTPAGVWAALKPHAAFDSLMVVGHQPLLGEFAAFVLNSPNLSINLKKSGLIRIDVEDVGGARSTAELRWLLTPAQLCAIGR